MERPFDYPGSTSDSITLDPSHLQVLSHSFTDISSDCQGERLWVGICTVPTFWSDDDISNMVSNRWESEHCTHSHDCCGHYYASTGRWTDLGRTDGSGDRMIVVHQSYSQNV